MTTRLTVAVIAALLLMVSALAVSAQDDETPAAEGRVEFALGDGIWELDPSVAVNACIAGERIDSGLVTLRLFGRTPFGFEPLGVFETALTEDLGQHPVGYCLPMTDGS